MNETIALIMIAVVSCLIVNISINYFNKRDKY